MTSRDALAALRDKYREMKRLRAAHVAGSGEDPKPEMAALAARFPGALRQIDRLTIEEIEARLALLDGALGEGASAPTWATWEIDYHARMRATLRVKRAVRGAADDAEALRRAIEAWGQLADEPSEAMTDERLRAIRAPERGRLNTSVLAAVAGAHGVSVEVIRRTIFVARDPEAE